MPRHARRRVQQLRSAVPRWARWVTARHQAKQLSHFFNSYAQAINKSFHRTGPLFESPFERKLVNNDEYISSLIYYCHYNAQLHQMVTNFKDWPYSSYHSILENNKNIVAVDKVLEWFGGRPPFIDQHEGRYKQENYKNIIL